MRNAVLLGDKIRVLFKGDHRRMNKECMVIITNIDPDVTHGVRSWVTRNLRRLAASLGL